MREIKIDVSIDHFSKYSKPIRTKVRMVGTTKAAKYRNTLSAKCKLNKHVMCTKLDCPCQCHIRLV